MSGRPSSFHFPRRTMIHYIAWYFSAVLCGVSHLIGCSYAYRPPLNHRDIAGLWKLTQSKPSPVPPTVFYPMKEFTVYPRDKERQSKRAEELRQRLALAKSEAETEEILLMLKEDGSFQQYSSDDDEKAVIPDKLRYHNDESAVLERFFGNIKGRWDFVDGKLYLAAERPNNIPDISEDTLLVGQVVATHGQSLEGNPALLNTNDPPPTPEQQQQQQTPMSGSNDNSNIENKKKATSSTPKMTSATTTSTDDDVDEDTHLSVPQGEVNVGKFTYPKNHPAFFDQPMFRPTPKGNFQLKQVLGNLNTQQRKEQAEAHLLEKFRVKDFYDKTFLLTAHPIGEYKPKGNKRWSIKYNKYVGKFTVRRRTSELRCQTWFPQKTRHGS